MAEDKPEKSINDQDKEKNDSKTIDDQNIEETSSTEEKQDNAEITEKIEEEIEMTSIAVSRLEELENAEAIFLENLKRERAESINYRKKVQRQRDDFAEFASSRVLTKLLAVKDDLSRLIGNLEKENVSESHNEAILLLSQRIEGIFEQEGVNLIKVDEGKTRYDPKFHEAIVVQQVSDVKPNTVLNLINQGFRKGDRVLRPAKVVISKLPEEPKKDTVTEEIKPVSENQSTPHVQPNTELNNSEES